MINIAIVGYGRMGKEIERIAIERGINVVSTIDPTNNDAKYKKIDSESLAGVDVAIDFTVPNAVVDNVERIAKERVNIVLGTTGWYDRKDEVKKNVMDNGVGLIWSGNFSIGVNMFFKIVDVASKLVNNAPEYDSVVTDIHHNQKVDSPSGTALMTANIMLKNIERKKEILEGSSEGKIKPEQLQVNSSNVGSVIGDHKVYFDSPADSIEIKHSAKNRSGFASGAVMAAEFIEGKKGFYSIDDLMKSIIGG